MSGFTHAAVGANAVWIAVVLGATDERAGLLIAAGALAALVPDIDAVFAKVHFLFGGLLSPFKGGHSGIFQHRGIWHSLYAVALVFALSVIFLYPFHPLLPFVVTLGYFSHPLIDGFNATVGYFFPFYNRRVTFWPRMLRTPVKGPVDQAFFAVAMLGLFLFLLTNLSTFSASFGNL